MMEIRIKDIIAPSFYDVHRDIREEKHTHYWFKGGRGSTKSSFVSIEIILGMMKDPNANAVALRKWKRRERLFKNAEDKEYYQKCK